MKEKVKNTLHFYVSILLCCFKTIEHSISYISVIIKTDYSYEWETPGTDLELLNCSRSVLESL